jgi:hypothetical protein
MHIMTLSFYSLHYKNSFAGYNKIKQIKEKYLISLSQYSKTTYILIKIMECINNNKLHVQNIDIELISLMFIS